MKKTNFFSISAVILAIIFMGLAFTSVWPEKKSPTCDELSHHIAVGYVFMTKGDFAFATDSPPLARCIMALPLLPMEIRMPSDRSYWAREDRGAFSWDFFYVLNRDIAGKMLLAARMTMIFLGAFGGLFLFFWVRKEMSGLTALLASFFYFLCPNIIANSQIATTDIAVTVFFMCSVFLFWDFLREKNSKTAVLAGVFLGFALLSKYSSLTLIPVFSILIASEIIDNFVKKRAGSGKLFLRFIFLLIVATAVLWAGYLFEFKPFFGNVLRPGEKELVLDSFFNRYIPGLNEQIKEGVRNFLYTFPIPLSSYILGVMGVLKHGAEGTGTYFLGMAREGGHPFYYVAAFLIKTPIPAILFFLTGIFCTVFKDKEQGFKLYLLLMISSFVTLASMGNLQLGLRYVLPVYPLMFVIAATGAAALIGRSLALPRVAVCVFLAWFGMTSFVTWPDYLSYFNESIGGPRNGYKYLRGSNIDWGQDLPALAAFLKEKGVENVVLVYHGSADPSYYGIKHEKISPEETVFPRAKVYAISAHSLGTVEWSEEYEPVAKIGYSIFVYDFRGRDLRFDEPDLSGTKIAVTAHMYPLSGYNKEGPTMGFFTGYLAKIAPARVVICGDSVRMADKRSLEFVKENVAGKIGPGARFILGNHDLTVPEGEKGTGYEDLFAGLFDKPHSYEDIGDIRLVYLNSNSGPGECGLYGDEIDFLKDALSGESYKTALVFLHHALWLGKAPYANRPYDNARRLEREWHDDIIPVFKRGRVKAVFSGDGGLKSSSFVRRIEGIPHYLTGWPFDVREKPADFLLIDLKEDGEISVYRYILSDGGISVAPIRAK